VAVPLLGEASERAPTTPRAAFGLAQTYDAFGGLGLGGGVLQEGHRAEQGNLQYLLTLAERYSQNDMNYPGHQPLARDPCGPAHPAAGRLKLAPPISGWNSSPRRAGIRARHTARAKEPRRPRRPDTLARPSAAIKAR